MREEYYTRGSCPVCGGKKGKMLGRFWHRCKHCKGTGVICRPLKFTMNAVKYLFTGKVERE